MKISVDTKSFVEAVAWVSKTLEAKDEKAYIALIVNKNGTGYLSYMNGQAYAKCPLVINKVELEDGEEVKLALEAQYTKRLASTLRDHGAPLELSKDMESNRTSLKVKRPNENYVIPILEARIGVEPKFEVVGAVDDGEYFDALKKLSRLADSSGSGIIPAIEAVDVRLDAEENKIVIMATDRYALSEIVIPYASAGDAKFYENVTHLLIPEAKASMISPSKGAVDAIELIHESKSKKFGYSFPDGRVVLFSLVNAEPVPYENIIKEAAKAENTALLSLDEFKNAVATVSSLVPDEAFLQLTIKHDKIVVADNHSVNKLNVTVLEVDGLDEDEELSVNFNRSVLNEALGPIATNRFNLVWQSKSKPFVFTPIYDDDTAADNIFILGLPARD